MFVLLRHPHDDDPETTYSLDPHITSKGISSINKNLKMLIREYGIPSVIYSSPLTRCRETSYYIRKFIRNKYDVNIKIVIDARISRYFTSKEKKDPDIREKSIKLNTPIEETWKEFKKRIKRFYIEHKNEIKNRNTLVWCVTHYLVIKEYSKILKFPIPDRMPYMWNIGLY